MADFGSSKRINELRNNENDSVTGTANWMAPEVIRQSIVSRFFNLLRKNITFLSYSDIWSLGCTVIEMATGRPPWSEYKNPVTIMFNIAKNNEPPPIPEDFSPDLRDFLHRCLKIIPSERANCHQLNNHTFITGNQTISKEIRYEFQTPTVSNRQFSDKQENFFEIQLKDKVVNYKENIRDEEENMDLKEDLVYCDIGNQKRASINDFSNPILVKLNSKILSTENNIYGTNNYTNNNDVFNPKVNTNVSLGDVIKPQYTGKIFKKKNPRMQAKKLKKIVYHLIVSIAEEALMILTKNMI